MLAYTQRELDAMAKVIACARAFVKVADEFFPEYPGAMDEHYEALVDAQNRLDAVNEEATQ